jgi:hypothetical protein
MGHQKQTKRSAALRVAFAVTLTLLAGLVAGLSTGAQADELAERFAAHDRQSKRTVDHAAWDAMLKQHVTPDDKGLHRVDYAAWKRDSRDALLAYIERMEGAEVAKLSRPEQYAYWVNLYNAVTVALILKHYPVDSIRDIDISPGFFSDGPWGAKLVEVGGVKLSLDNIEHDILREIWADPRVHYAVNCASVGCPNLARDAYTGDRLDDQLDAAARAYIASPRGIRFDGGRVTASKIYSWYDEDFGNSESGIIAHISDHAEGETAERLAGLSSIDDYEYDWSLNDVRR